MTAAWRCRRPLVTCKRRAIGRWDTPVVRGFSTLAVGNVLGQVIVAACVPVIARIYGPSVFGVYGIYMTAVSVMGSVATLRYDFAIALPHRDSSGTAAVWLAVVASLGVAAAAGIVIGVVAWLAHETLDGVGGAVVAATIPLAVAAIGINNAVVLWANRTSHFRTSATAGVTKSVVTCAIQFMPVARRCLSGGLVAGYVAGQVASTWMPMRHFLESRTRFRSRQAMTRRMMLVARRYRNFPAFSAPQAFLNALSQGVPVILLGYFFDARSVGFYVLAQRVLQSPAEMITSALHNALYVDFAKRIRRPIELKAQYVKYTCGMAGLAAVPAIGVLVFAGPVVRIVLGAEWSDVAAISRWLVLWIACLSANVPARVVVNAFKKTHVFLAYDIALACARAAAIVIGGVAGSFMLAVMAFAVVSALFNVFLILFGYSLLVTDEGMS
jgi:O-antigen/teichoic acid export membrane protein